MYGDSDRCHPICGAAGETLGNVLQCSHPSVETVWSEQLLVLKRLLNAHSTPLPVSQAILHGFLEWLSPSSHPHAHTVRIYSQGEPPLICSGAKAASTIPVAEIFVRTLRRYLARKAKYN